MGWSGYAGFAGRVPVGTEDTSLKEKTETLACRGPDASAVRAEDAAGLGHTRPATVDLVGGRQPLVLARGGRTVLTVAFTGEVCNHVRLRRELTALGHRFTTRSDSEAVLHAIDAWGERAPGRMEGMFAYVSAGTPETEGPVPVAATRTVLARVGPGLADVGTVAGNEPFAAQILAYCAQLGLDPERMNPHGGSIALREPYGGPAPGSPAPL